ncbi:MAG: hypothetical protein O2913_09405 [Chloroflexi bacterium]|nr:hypothetical protein [Chloroflexota bacterium]
MTTTTLPVLVREPKTEVSHVPDHLMKELEEVVAHAVAEPELVHWFHFVPCAGVRYYSYHKTPSPVESIRPRKQ